MTDILWSNDDIIFTDGDIVWKAHETDMQAESIGMAFVSGTLNVATKLNGSITAISYNIADFTIYFKTCCLDTYSSVNGILDSQPGLGSSIIEISGTAATLSNIEIATKLKGLIIGAFDADGYLNVATKLQSSIAGTSGVLGYLNFRFLSIPIVAISGVSGNLNFTYLTYEHSEEDGQPVELYLFDRDDGLEYWSYTSTDYDIVHNNRNYSGELIRRSPIRLTANSLKTQLEIEIDLHNPFVRNFIPCPVEGVIQLTIYRHHADSYVTYWKGYVHGVSFKVNTAIVFVGLKTGSLKRFGLMRKYQRLCGVPLYSTWCTIAKDNANYKITGTINTVDGVTLDVTFPAEKPDNWDDDWLKGGIFKTDNGNCLQKITYHVGSAIKIVRSVSTLIAGQTFVAWAGCDHLRTTCRTKFGIDIDPVNGNVLNYGGQPHLPDKNPFAGDAII